MMPLRINDKTVKLVLKGFVTNHYRQKINHLIELNQAWNDVEFIGLTPYQDLPKITSGCHIGIAIFSNDNIMSNTLY